MKAFWFLWMTLSAYADEVVDLGDLGAGSFSPYILERNPLWILLPVALIAIVVWHLRKPKKIFFPGEQANETDENSSDHPNVLPLHRE
ncbi:MAG: hypothetical protein R3B54_15275 [Bdellovibrionota bacterium]